MTKKTLSGGCILLTVFTVLVAVGIFLMQRYNGIANAESKILENVVAIDATVTDQKGKTSELQKLTDGTVAPQEKEITYKKSSLQNDPEEFFKDDTAFQKQLHAFLDVVAAKPDLAKDAKISEILGEIQADAADLRNEKAAYNAAVESYNKKRNAAPKFYSDLLGFTDYEKFSNVATPLDSTSDDSSNTQDQNQNPDINSFN